MSGLVNKAKNIVKNKNDSVEQKHDASTSTTGGHGDNNAHETTGGVPASAGTSATGGGYEAPGHPGPGDSGGINDQVAGAGSGVPAADAGPGATDPGLTSGNQSGGTGPHGSTFANKLDPRIDSDRDGSRNAGLASGQDIAGSQSTAVPTSGGYDTGTGPHGSRLADKFDSRVDSDRDGSRNAGLVSGQNTAGSYSTAGPTSGGHDAGTGPHGSRLADKLDPRVDSDHDGSRNAGLTSGQATAGSHSAAAPSGYGSTGPPTGGYDGSTGPHGSALANKLDPRVDSDRDGSRNAGLASGQATAGSHSAAAPSGYGNTGPTSGGYATGTAGPHHSNLANRADPRVDSDRDGSRNAGFAGGSGAASSTYNTGAPHPASYDGTAGPHRSDLANTADPRVDSDRDGSRNAGLAGDPGVAAGGVYNSGGTTSGQGPHASGLANRADPRVDSDRDGSRNAGLAGGPGAAAGGAYNSGTTFGQGPHASGLANRADPRVDSDNDGSGNAGLARGHGAAAGGVGAGQGHSSDAYDHDAGAGAAREGHGNTFPGLAPNTAGPHKSDLLNKLDPRVKTSNEQSRAP
ncbi:MAG: hypothetical protein M1821_000520 [Bathelium mastoideum]|nr:MAG: hypothetical protein M1821_000520 [Bathelium mastoideum]